MLRLHAASEHPETQVAALERKREERMEWCEIETAHPDHLGSPDTFYVGNMKGVGRIYQQTLVDTISITRAPRHSRR
jgi:hypothetical protein